MTGRFLRITALSAMGLFGLATSVTPTLAAKVITPMVPKLAPIVPKVTPPPKIAAVKPLPAPNPAPAPAPAPAKAPAP